MYIKKLNDWKLNKATDRGSAVLTLTDSIGGVFLNVDPVFTVGGSLVLNDVDNYSWGLTVTDLNRLDPLRDPHIDVTSTVTDYNLWNILASPGLTCYRIVNGLNTKVTPYPRYDSNNNLIGVYFESIHYIQSIKTLVKSRCDWEDDLYVTLKCTAIE